MKMKEKHTTIPHEVIVRLTSNHIKVKGGEYVQDIVRCGKCKAFDDKEAYCKLHDCFMVEEEFCSYGKVRNE